MNRTIPLQGLIESMAKAAGAPVEVAQQYVEALSKAVGDALEAGQSVHVKGIGEFRPNPDDGDSPVLFAPAEELAKAVNQPFEAFESVELDVPADVLAALMAKDTPTPPEEAESPEPIEEIEMSEESAQSDQSDQSDESDEPKEPQEPVQPEIPVEEPESSDEEYYGEEPRKASRRWVWLLIGLILGMAIGAGGMWLWLHQQSETSTETSRSENSQPEAILSKAESVASDEPEATIVEESNVVVMDTIRSNRFLTTMARDHYGHYEYWAYIYQENEEALGNINYVAPGTPVVIPSLKKYVEGNPDDSLNIAKAAVKAREIQLLYPRKK